MSSSNGGGVDISVATMTTPPPLLPLMPQSRRLSSRSGVERAWLRALFDFMDRRPRSAIYSMAFALTCIRTYELSGSNVETRPDLVAAFEAARELLNLLSDNVHGRRGDSEFASSTDFARTNDLYVSAFEDTYMPVLRYCMAITAANNNDPSSSSSSSDEAAAIRLGGDDDTRRRAAALEISRVLELANEHAARSGMLLPANARCSFAVERIDPSPLSSSDDLRDVLSRPVTIATAAGVPAYTYLKAYSVYAPVVYRYESLVALISRWNEAHGAATSNDDDDDDGSIEWILLPTHGVWQGGTSQILWIVMHTLAALTVQRRNAYIHRAVALLEHLSFYVWCADCFTHWLMNRGDDYFRHVGSLVRVSKLPIDIVLLRCHNTVNANSGGLGESTIATMDDRNGFASPWTLANLCLDYRDFATIGLLRRGGSRESARAHRAALCRPLVRSVERINGVVERDDDDDYLLSDVALADSGGNTSPAARVTLASMMLDAMKRQHGEMLLRRLWHDIDPSCSVPICAAMP